tara:strand:- start:5936 stop:7831 length:1896 start_codon:yes stop_codon:yes gene_type:complete
MRDDRVDVCFVVAPFLPEHQPALGVSSLAAVLTQAGHSAEIRYLNLEFAQTVGFALSSHIGGSLPVELLLGEMVFAPALWPDNPPDWQTYVAALKAWFVADPRLRAPSFDIDELLSLVKPLHDNALHQIEIWADQLCAERPRIIGFTTTFQQNTASLALARAIRQRTPADEIAIIFGGANCEADMGRALADNFPFIDHVVSGEGEATIAGLVERILDGTQSVPARHCDGAPVTDMDRLPVPVFDHYFAQIAGTEMQSRFNLVAESSRGCWWGMKSHCTFCGLNGGNMGFRAKSPERFWTELRALRTQWRNPSFMLSDNIMDMKYVKSLLPMMIEDGEPIELFYETKANLRKDQLEIMAAAGITRLQPGIESLSTKVLKLMGKGTTLLQNLQVLKWCEELKIGLAWNVLAGFPGEPPEEYERIAELIPALSHLPAPTCSGVVRLDRFSPYWRDPGQFGLHNVRHSWAYDHVYAALPSSERSRIAYFFEFDHQAGDRPNDYLVPMMKGISEWRKDYAQKASLELSHRNGEAFVLDSRAAYGGDPDRPLHSLVSGAELEVLIALDAISSSEKLTAALPGLDTLPEILSSMLERGWIVREANNYLSLVLDRSARQRVLDHRVQGQLASFGLALSA